MVRRMGSDGGPIASPCGSTVTLTPSRRLYALGAILLFLLALCARKFTGTGEPSFIIFLCTAGVVYLLAVRELFSAPDLPKRVIVIGLGLAVVWHVLFLVKPPGPDDDIHRYVWDGRVQRLGYNPYALIPGDPSVLHLHTAETRALNNPDVPSPYPAGAQLFFRAVTAVRESVFALKAAFVICDLAIVLVLLDLLRSRRQPAHWVLVFAWNPLLATEVAGSGHIDVVGALLLLVSVAALLRRWRAVAATAFALAVAVKFLPIVLLPLYWRRLRIRDALLAAFVFGLLYLPFFGRGGIPVGSLGTYVQRFRFNGPVFAMLEQISTPQIAAALALLAGFVTAAWLRSRSEALSSRAFAWPMAASLLCAPVVYPWYLLWLLPFLRSASTVPMIVWTVSVIPVYYVWHLRTLAQPWRVPGWIMLLEYGAVAVAAGVIGMPGLAQPSRHDESGSKTAERENGA